MSQVSFMKLFNRHNSFERLGSSSSSDSSLAEREKLDFTGIPLSFPEVRAISRLLKTSKIISSLKLCYNGLCDKGLKKLSKGIAKSESLRTLTIGWNEGLTSGGVHYLAAALKQNTSVETLILHKNNLDDTSVEFLAEALFANSTLHYLGLPGNLITSTGAIYLAVALEHNRTLQHLDLRSNLITSSGASHLAKSLKRNGAIQTLDISFNSIGSKGAHSFAKLLLTAVRLPTNHSPDYDINFAEYSCCTSNAETCSACSSLSQLGVAGNGIGEASIRVLKKAALANCKVRVVDVRMNEVVGTPAQEGERKREREKVEEEMMVIKVSKGPIVEKAKEAEEETV